MSLVSVISDLTTRIATEFNAIRTEIAALTGGTNEKPTDFPDWTDATLALEDVFYGVDKSDTTDSAAGSDKKGTLRVIQAGLRKLLTNVSVTSQTGFATDTYLVGSDVLIPAGFPIVGTTYRLIFDVTKTNAGTATPIITIRVGTAGTTADTSRVVFTFGAGTTAVDTGIFEAIVTFRTVGGSTTAVLQGICRLTSNLTTTGLSNAVKARATTSSGFDSTVSSLKIGASYNGGTSAAHTIQLVRAELIL